jgi:uncharacterized membrane protein
VDDIVSRLTEELKYLNRLGWWNHYAAYFFHLVSILASFAASLLAAFKSADVVLPNSLIWVAVVAAVPGTLLATQNVLRFEHKCRWYYKKARLLQHVLDTLKFEHVKPEQASKKMRDIADQMDREWPGFGTVGAR